MKLYWLALLAAMFVNTPGCSSGTGAANPEVEAEQERLNEELGEDQVMTPEEEAQEE